MPRRAVALPVYEIPTDPAGTLRLKLSVDRRRLIVEHVVDADKMTTPFFLDGKQWRSLCDLRDILMPKRSTRKADGDG